MSVDIWFTQDISQIILAAVRANEQALAADLADRDPQPESAYHQGIRAALSAVALAQAENADTRQSGLSVVPVEESRGHRFAVV